MRSDLYRTITETIIAAIEAGASPTGFGLPWHRNSGDCTPFNAISGRPYNGINTLLLWAASNRFGYTTGEWGTYRQWATAGAQVRKGEQASVVLLWKTVRPDEVDDLECRDRQRRMIARAFYVFNAAQVDGWTPERPPLLPLSARITRAEAFFAALPARVSHDSADAFYDRAGDSVFLPSFSAFTSAQTYYSVYAHELIHWSGAKQRLDRDLSGRFGSEAYAMEELVAELGAAFIVGHLRLAATPREDHAHYIASWLAVFAGDSRAIVTAASRAQVAADYLVGLADPVAAAAELQQA